MKRTNSKASRSKKGKLRADPFALFQQATAEAFKFLVDNHGFKQVSIAVQPPECEINYRNRTTGVSVTYEWGGVAWVDLSRLKQTPNEPVEDEKYSLDILMLACGPKRDVNEFYPSEDEVPSKYVERVLPEYARILEECGRDILSGDFRLLPKLKKQAENVLHHRNKELFGSEAGVT